jgi:hypothetical protein
VINYNIDNGALRISPFILANEVMKIHYENKVGLVPLSKTVHELAHNGEIFINLNQIFGDVKSFIMKYENGITDELVEQLKHLIALSSKYGENYSPKVLDKKISYLDIENVDSIQRIYKNEDKRA